jgi:hypothetical protein
MSKLGSKNVTISEVRNIFPKHDPPFYLDPYMLKKNFWNFFLFIVYGLYH